jgi:hypothetical protein
VLAHVTSPLLLLFDWLHNLRQRRLARWIDVREGRGTVIAVRVGFCLHDLRPSRVGWVSLIERRVPFTKAAI